MSEDWRTQLFAARDPSPEVESRQDVWDAKWQPLYEQGWRRGLTPNAAIHRADRVMDIRGQGPRPEPKEASR